MAEITVAESAGFCFGVDRAVKLCYQALEEHHNIATLGPIIHNQDVVDDLTRRGARIVDSIAAPGRMRGDTLSRRQRKGV